VAFLLHRFDRGVVQGSRLVIARRAAPQALVSRVRELSGIFRNLAAGPLAVPACRRDLAARTYHFVRILGAGG